MPPTVPTSFVPKQPVAARRRSSGTSPLMAIAYFILAVAVVGAIAVTGYKYYLAQVAESKAQAVDEAQKKVDQATVTEFIRLRNRFTAAGDVLNHQVALSQFFDTLESATLQNVRYSSLQITITPERRATVHLTGTAKSFNTLAAESQQLASDKRIKRAIFSGINTVKDSNVSFELSAELDPMLIERSVGSAQSQSQVPVQPQGGVQVIVGTTTRP